MKRPRRTSTLSLKQRLHAVEQENLTLREALETIADVLEEVGILDGGEDAEIEEPEEPEPEAIIEGTAEVTDDAKE